MLTGLNSGEFFYFIPPSKSLLFLHMVRKLKNRDLKTTLKSPYSGEKKNILKPELLLNLCRLRLEEEKMNEKFHFSTNICPLSIERKIKLVRTKAIKCSLSL